MESRRRPAEFRFGDGLALCSAWHVVGPLRVHSRFTTGAPPTAPVLVLVHGVAVSSRYMTPAAVALGSDFRVHVPDLPGFGLSDSPHRPLGIRASAQALLAWIAAAGIECAALLGNSVGSQVAVEAALEAPEKVVALVLTGPTVDADARSGAVQVGRWLRNARHERVSQAPALVRDLLDTGPRRPIALFRDALRDPIEHKVERIRQPVLVVRGERDPVVPDRWARRLADAAPRGRLTTVPGGHNVNYTAPLELASKVRAFI